MPIIITLKSKGAVKTEVEDAEKHGILVITKEDLEDIINKDLLMPYNAEQIYSDALKSNLDKKAQYKKQPELI